MSNNIESTRNAEGQNAVGQNVEGQNAADQNAVGQNAVGENAVGQNAVGQNAEGQNAEGQNVRALPKVVTDHLFQYLTDTHVRRLIMANGNDGEQLFDNMRESKEHFDNIPKCWDCWPKTEVTVYTRGRTPQPRDGPCVGYCKK